MRPLLVFTALLSLAGCSSWQPDAEDIEPVPAERVLAYQQPLENGGEVVVTRDFGLRGGGCYIAVLIDRQLAARIHVGEVVRFQVPAGARIVSIGTDPLDDTLCGSSACAARSWRRCRRARHWSIASSVTTASASTSFRSSRSPQGYLITLRAVSRYSLP